MLEEFDASTFADKYQGDNDGILIDVRTPFEFKQGHIPNSLLIDINDPAFTGEIDKLDRSKNYYVYCRSGNRSFHAGRYMLSIGFKNVFRKIFFEFRTMVPMPVVSSFMGHLFCQFEE